MDYQSAYQQAVASLEMLLREEELLQSRILQAQKKIAALSTLVGLSGEPRNRISDSDTPNEVLQFFRTRLAHHLRRVLVSSRQPLTIAEIRSELKELGFDMSDMANPWASITSVCNRFVNEGFLEEVAKNGKRAWKHCTSRTVKQRELGARRAGTGFTQTNLKRARPGEYRDNN